MNDLVIDQGCIKVNGVLIANRENTKKIADLVLGEFFEERGWSIDSENPNLIVLPRPSLDDTDGRAVIVVDLQSGDTGKFWERWTESRFEELSKAADRYFATTPTWHTAQPGQLWRVQIADEPHPAFVISNSEGDPIFVFDDGSDLHITDPSIITATRIQIGDKD